MIATRKITYCLPALILVSGCTSFSGIRSLYTGPAACYNRSTQPQTSLVDSHVHFRPFGGEAIPFEQVVGYLEDNGILFANIYGIGQTLPGSSDCTYYLDCPGTPVTPTLTNDLINAANLSASDHKSVHLTLAMTFPDLAHPETILSGMRQLDKEHPGVFKWMGEVNLVKQALFANHRPPVPMDTLPQWAPFMKELRDRDIPLAVHADLGSDEEPTRYLPLVAEMLRLYPDNIIVWVHMGLSRELVDMDAAMHIRTVKALMDRYPNLMLDISWRVLEDAYFSDPDKQPLYVSFLNEYSERILPGTDFLASSDKDSSVYRTELEVTSRILSELSDTAFRNIALGQNYAGLMRLDYAAPEVCLTE